MEIKTKFNIGDEVLVLIRGKIIQQIIKEIHITKIIDDDIIIHYRLSGGFMYNEQELYKNKEELINYINSL